MFGSVVKGLFNAANEAVTETLNFTAAAASIVGTTALGGEPKGRDVRALVSAGMSIADIASAYGVARHVIDAVVMEDES